MELGGYFFVLRIRTYITMHSVVLNMDGMKEQRTLALVEEKLPAMRRFVFAEDGVAEEIFCDEESRFQMMQRVIKGRMLPLLILFFTVLLPQFISHLFYTRYYLIASLIGGVLAMYLTIFGMCFVKYTQYKNRRK